MCQQTNMADKNRKHQIAAAKKKLKEFQNGGSVSPVDISLQLAYNSNDSDNVNELNGTDLRGSSSNSHGDSQLRTEIEDLRGEISRLQRSIESERMMCEDKMKRELGAFKEQLQVHIQTIGILVTEKTELQSVLNKNITTVETQLVEIKELSNQLKASQQRVSELERNDNATTDKQVQLELALHQNAELMEELAQRHLARSQYELIINELSTRESQLKTEVLSLARDRADLMSKCEVLLSAGISDNKRLMEAEELHVQIDELRDSVLKLTGDNSELTARLQSEQRVMRDLTTRLAQLEDQLKETNQHLSLKEQELMVLRRRDTVRAAAARTYDALSSEESDDSSHHGARHEEFVKQSQAVESLQHKVSAAQETINSLTNQNADLECRLAAAASRMKEDSSDAIRNAQFESLQHAMKQLEDKYTRVMKEKAELVDMNEQLEHVTLQLQGETDTIGEYVSLYQQQRSVLRQRTEEKDEYISRLSHERVNMEHKLGELQALLMQLLSERNMLHSYHNNSRSSSPSLPLATTSSNHVASSPPPRRRKPRTRHPDQSGAETCAANGTTDLEAWPDLSGSSSSESESLDELIIRGSVDNNLSPLESPLHSSISWLQTPSPHNGTRGVGSPSLGTGRGARGVISPNLGASGDRTAQRIMSILNEIGTCNVIDRTTLDDRVHCNRCLGTMINV